MCCNLLISAASVDVDGEEDERDEERDEERDGDGVGDRDESEELKDERVRDD